MSGEMTVVENPGWLDELLHQGKAIEALHGAAGAAHETILAAVPVDTGHYKANFEEGFTVESDGNDVALVTRSHFYHIIEWGSVNNPPYAPIRRGVENAGLKWEGN